MIDFEFGSGLDGGFGVGLGLVFTDTIDAFRFGLILWKNI